MVRPVHSPFFGVVNGFGFYLSPLIFVLLLSAEPEGRGAGWEPEIRFTLYGMFRSVFAPLLSLTPHQNTHNATSARPLTGLEDNWH